MPDAGCVRSEMRRLLSAPLHRTRGLHLDRLFGQPEPLRRFSARKALDLVEEEDLAASRRQRADRLAEEGYAFVSLHLGRDIGRLVCHGQPRRVLHRDDGRGAEAAHAVDREPQRYREKKLPSRADRPLGARSPHPQV